MSVFSAPGKLIIAGEYAVLEGHPALVTAVDRRAMCRLEPGDELTVSGLGRGPLPVVVEPDDVTVEDDDGTFRLVEHVLREAHARGVALPRGHLSVDTGAFFLGHEKLGLGSSAAAAVALSAQLLTDDDGDVAPEAVRDLAATAHDRFSGSARGSGVDVAASSHGGVLRFAREPGATVELSSWNLCPKRLSVLVPFAGAAANTREFLTGLRRFEKADARGYERAIDDIGYATLELLDAVRPNEDPRVFLAAVDRCRRSMQRLGERADLDIVSAPHRAIARIARSHGGAAKPSGAGGGDVAVCFVPDDERDACVVSFEDAGFPVIDVVVGAEGARRE